MKELIMEPKEIRYYLDSHNDSQSITTQIEESLCLQYQAYRKMDLGELESSLVSQANWGNRHHLVSAQQLGITISEGDICFLDYGLGYLKEAGYQHFGLILSFCYGKAFVIPMTSNQVTYQQAYSVTNPLGKKHLFPLGIIPGLNKRSVLFLNDGKYLNTARIIAIKAHLDPAGSLYKEIKERVKECLKL